MSNRSQDGGEKTGKHSSTGDVVRMTQVSAQLVKSLHFLTTLI
jgi:hypothetical protein